MKIKPLMLQRQLEEQKRLQIELEKKALACLVSILLTKLKQTEIMTTMPVKFSAV